VSNFFSSAVAAAGNVAIGLVSVFFIAYYFLIDSKLFNGIITTVVPRSYEANASHAINESVSLLFSYFRGLLLQVAFVAVYVSGLLFVLGVPNALLIGVLTALLNVIPYVGPIISSVIAGLLTVSSSLGMDFFAEIVPLLLKVAGVIATMQVLDNFIVQPYIFSKSVQAHPLEIFFVVMIGAQVAGITGMIIAIPVYTVLRVFARVFWSEYKIVQRLTGHLDDD
jgi:predicted PurR-regulated permease PerM